MPHLLLVDDDPEALEWLSELAKAEGFSVAQADSLRAARIHMSRLQPDILLTDLQLPDGKGIDLVADLEQRESTEVVMITGHASVESAVEALRLGATDYLVKPVDVERLKAILRRVPRTGELRAARSASCATSCASSAASATSSAPRAPMQKLYDQLGRVAPTAATVLLIGESGTGKELAAQTIHDLSRRKQGAVPAAQLRRGLAAADRERAVRPREGQLHRRRPPAQGLLRARPRRHAVPRRDHRDAAGAAGEAAARARDRHVHARGRHHADQRRRARASPPPTATPRRRWPTASCARTCYHRLNVFPIAHAAAARARQRHRAAGAALPRGAEPARRAPPSRSRPRTIAALYAHSWPGNVRELKNYVQRAFILADDVIDANLAPAAVAAPESRAAARRCASAPRWTR